MKCNFFNKHKWIYRNIEMLHNNDETDSVDIPIIRFCSKCGLIQKNLYKAVYYTYTKEFSINHRWFTIGIKKDKDANCGKIASINARRTLEELNEDALEVQDEIIN